MPESAEALAGEISRELHAGRNSKACISPLCADSSHRVPRDVREVEVERIRQVTWRLKSLLQRGGATAAASDPSARIDMRKSVAKLRRRIVRITAASQAIDERRVALQSASGRWPTESDTGFALPRKC